MFAPLKNQKGFTLIELVIIIILIGILAAIAVPKYVDLRNKAKIAAAQATMDSGKAAIALDFADEVLTNGTYVTLTNLSSEGAEFNATDVTDIEGLLQPNPPTYPTTYGGTGYRWWLITQGSTTTTSSPLAPVITAVMDVVCDATVAIGGTPDTNCDMGKI